MGLDLEQFHLVTASAYAGMMAPLTHHRSTVCVLTGDTDSGDADSGCADSGYADSGYADGDAGGRSVVRMSLEGLDGVRRHWRLSDLARLADFVPKVLARSSTDGRTALVLPPRTTVAWEQAAATWPREVRLLGRPAADVSQIADDKVFVRAQLHRLGVPVPDSLVATGAELSDGHLRMVRRLGEPFVLQAPQGAGGHGTYLIESAAQLADALTGHDPPRWLVSRYAGDVTINVPGLVHRDGVEVMPASVQTSGIAALGADYGSYCGSDFGAPRTLAPGVLDEAASHTRRIGQWLHAVGHRGIFGADVAVSGADIAFLEVNPRIQGSSWLLSRAQRRAGQPECLVDHVRALLDQSPERRAADEPTATGSHLILRWSGRPGTVRSVPSPGIYRIGALGRGVTVTALPTVGTVLTPGAIAARLETDGSLATSTGGTLRADTTDLVESLRAAIEVAR